MNTRQGWTFWQIVLAGVCGILGVGITVLSFIDLFVTVNHLVAPWWHWLAWTVVFIGEGSFTGTYLGWLLIDLKGKASRPWRLFILAILSVFAAASLTLNVYAGRYSLPDAVSHLIVVVAFFGYLIFAKMMVRQLSADPAKQAIEAALNDTRRYAIDYCKASRGPLWRWRVPSLVRVQILRSRLPDEVRQAVEMRASMGGWQKDVREWLSGPDALNLQRQAESDTRSASEAIAQSAPQAAPEPVSQVAAQTASPAAPRTSPGTARKPTPSAVKRMTPGDLAPYVGTLLETAPGTTPSDLMKSLRIGRDKATEALKLARRERLQAVAK